MSQNGTPSNSRNGKPMLKIIRKPLSDLHNDPNNANTHPRKNLDAIANSLKSFGQVEPLVVQKSTGKVIGGNGRLDVMRENGDTHADIVEIDVTDEKATAMGIALNRTSELSEWDNEVLLALVNELPDDMAGLIGFDDADLAQIVKELEDEQGPADGLTDPDDIPEAPEPITKPGDLWALGDHRVLCGDSMRLDHVEVLMSGEAVDLVCTDPPYCSGGFQECGKSAGSVGTDAPHKQIANDRLSTRGYGALLQAAIGNLGAPFLYAFTDWRMWIYLFDTVESLGYGVRSMIAWDKGTPGMGRGWRSQHELIMWACKSTPPLDKHASGQGNVIQAKRTGNKHHTTEKPVELIETILINTPFALRVADPFCGSGTTLIACERANRMCYGMELDPAYCDVIVKRWEEFTGRKAELITNKTEVAT